MSIARIVATAAGRNQFWNISAAEYAKSFSVSAQDTAPFGIFFKPDGTKMYISGAAGQDVNEYNLSSAWNVATATYNQRFSVSAQDTGPRGVFFKTDGTKMYVVGAVGDDVNEYNLSSAWNISTAIYNQNFSVAAQELSPVGVFFKPDGMKMYIVGSSGDDVNEYDLSLAWDVSTADYNQNFSVSAQDTAPFGIFFKPDGAKMYIAGAAGRDVNEYNLSSAWDISTAVYVQNFSVAGEGTTPSGLFFRHDGSKMYIVGADPDSVHEYSVGIKSRQLIYKTAGTYTFTVPTTISTVNASLVGGAGGGASGGTTVSGDKNPVTTNYFGGDGGSGASATKALSVTPGETLTIVVGSGGAGGAAPNIENVAVNPGSNGTDSTVTQSASVVARADAGSGAPSTTDGAGGLASASVGDTRTNGVTGAGGAGGFGASQSGTAGIAGSVTITW
jgi:hypothetical protein